MQRVSSPVSVLLFGDVALAIRSWANHVTIASVPFHFPTSIFSLLASRFSSHCFFSFLPPYPQSRSSLSTWLAFSSTTSLTLMLDDFLALTTTLIHSDHEHELSAASGSETDIMAPRSRHTKSASVASSTDADTIIKGTDLINGGMLPPATTPDRTTTRTSKRRPSRSTTSPPSSPVVVVPATRSVVVHPEEHKNFEIVKFVGTVVLSTLLEAGLQTAASFVGTGDYAAISKRADTWPEIVGLLAWKIAKLGIYWAADFDGTSPITFACFPSD
jgi:hypothetical protein